MESPSLLTKALTLTLFLLLMSGFVAYRLGAFEHKTTRTDLALVSGPAVDSPEEKPKLIMSSSKSMSVTEPYRIKAQSVDSPVKQQTNPERTEPTVMPSSKSGPIFRPAQNNPPSQNQPQQQQSNPQ